MFVPADFVVPLRLETPQFRLEPLGPEHNDADYGAWSSSVEHIHATPGWEESSWPRDMTLEENRADLQRHADAGTDAGPAELQGLLQGSEVVGHQTVAQEAERGSDTFARTATHATATLTATVSSVQKPKAAVTVNSECIRRPMITSLL